MTFLAGKSGDSIETHVWFFDKRLLDIFNTPFQLSKVDVPGQRGDFQWQLSCSMFIVMFSGSPQYVIIQSQSEGNQHNTDMQKRCYRFSAGRGLVLLFLLFAENLTFGEVVRAG